MCFSYMAKREELSDEQWAIIEPILWKRKLRDDGKGRSPKSNREILNSILWILRFGARCKDLPERFPSYQTCHRRFQYWERTGTLLETLAKDLSERGKFDLSKCFIYASRPCREAKKGASGLEKPSAAKLQTTLRVLRRMRSPLFSIPSKNGFSDNVLDV